MYCSLTQHLFHSSHVTCFMQHGVIVAVLTWLLDRREHYFVASLLGNHFESDQLLTLRSGAKSRVGPVVGWLAHRSKTACCSFSKAVLCWYVRKCVYTNVAVETLQSDPVHSFPSSMCIRDAIQELASVPSSNPQAILACSRLRRRYRVYGLCNILSHLVAL